MFWFLIFLEKRQDEHLYCDIVTTNTIDLYAIFIPICGLSSLINRNNNNNKKLYYVIIYL